MKLTAREKEIVEALQKEPLISQDDLALQFGISRSSVAVHISNLMKKGIILGKGYVFNQKASIVVVGRVGLDIMVHQGPDSTSIEMKHAGYGLKMCQALSEFGVNPKLITVVGNDELGSSIVDELLVWDADITNIYRDAHKKTCTRIISNQGLNLAEGCSQQEFQQAIAAREWVISNCDWLLVEPDLQAFVTANLRGRPGGAPCMAGVWQGQGDMPLSLEGCEVVVRGVDNFGNHESYVNQAVELLKSGTQNYVITDGNTNVVAVNAEGAKDYPLLPNQIFDSQADLDTFLAGLVYGLSARYPLRQALRIASGAAHNSHSKEIGR